MFPLKLTQKKKQKTKITHLESDDHTVNLMRSLNLKKKKKSNIKHMKSMI